MEQMRGTGVHPDLAENETAENRPSVTGQRRILEVIEDPGDPTIFLKTWTGDDG